MTGRDWAGELGLPSVPAAVITADRQAALDGRAEPWLAMVEVALPDRDKAFLGAYAGLLGVLEPDLVRCAVRQYVERVEGTMR